MIISELMIGLFDPYGSNILFGLLLTIEGAFVQGIEFFMLEEYLTNSDGLVVT